MGNPSIAIVGDSKVCTKCDRAKPTTEFYRKSSGYLRSWCKECWHADVRQRASEERYHLRYRQDSPARVAARARWAERNADRVRLIQAGTSKVFKAVQAGTLVRPDTCSACGAAGRVEASHDDYSRLLDVTWLCLPCHRARDRQDPKTLRALAVEE